MFWNNVASVYDIFQKIYNGRVNKKMCIEVMNLISEEDDVLECACGTGMISVYIARKCKSLVATDLAPNMLKIAKKKCKSHKNVQFEFSDITALTYEDNTFDIVVAGNVIHLLDNPYVALKELSRVCKEDGKIIIPTYITKQKKDVVALVNLWNKFGANFKVEYDETEYRSLFEKANIEEIDYITLKGRIPSSIAIIKNKCMKNMKEVHN